MANFIDSAHSNRGKVAPEEQRPETRDHGGREEITLSAVVCGALEHFSPQKSGGPDKGQ